MNNDLKWVINQGMEEVNYYLETVTNEQFVLDVKELLKKQADKSAIEEAIKRLQELINP